MNDAWSNYGDETNNGGGLRQFAEAMQAQNKELLSRLDAMENERKQERLESVFNNLGVPEASKVYKGDATPEAATAWVTEMRSVFGNGIAQGEPVQAPVQTQPALTEEQASQFQRMTEAGSQGVPMGNVEAAQLGVNNATDLESLIAAFNNGMNRQ